MRSFGLLCTLFLLGAIPVFGQDQTAPPPAHISFVEGTATIDHDGESDPAVLNMPVLEGDRIRTANGRVEVLFADGSAVAIDPDSDVEFLGGTRVRVVAGAIEHRAAAAPDPASSPYLPQDLQYYGNEFDRDGTWQYDASYGNVWYPTVAADWRPYYYGYWAPVRTYGWTWIGYDRWTWPTHHYGRWGYARNRWFWIPGRTWAAAWVSWGTAPDYVSWCPLGYDGRPVVDLSIGYRSAWNAWTVVPRDRFGVRGYSVHRYAIEPYRLASTTPFVIHRSAPLINRRASYGVSRSAVAVPRYDRSPASIDPRSRGISRSPGQDNRASELPYRGRAYTAPNGIDRVPRADGRPTVPGSTTPPTAVYRTPGSSNRAGDYRVPRPGSRAPSAPPYDGRARVIDRQSTTFGRPAIPDRRPPAVERGPSPTTGHPAYQPRYQPRYEAPRAEPRQPPAGVMRPGPAPRAEAAPRPQTRQAAPQSAPAPRAGGNAGPRAAPGGNGGGHGRSDGTAVRRPR